MKKIALFILLLFATVQIVPALRAFAEDSKGQVFAMDEEKNNGKNGLEDIRHKYEMPYWLLQGLFTFKKKANHYPFSEKIHPTPCLDRLTPPPNMG